MARPLKQGIEYFSFDTNFFSDIKIRKISRACGPNSISILICLLCNIYKDEGYYILWDEDLPFVIADTVGVTEGAVTEVIKKAIQVDFFDGELYEKYNILTSQGIQRRFQLATYQRKEITFDERFRVNHANNSVNCTNNSVNCMKSTQSKEKGKEKEKKSLLREIKKTSSPPGDVEIALTDCYEQLSKNEEWSEVLTMNTRNEGYPAFGKSHFTAYLKKFFRKLANEGIKAKSPQDDMSHFSRWLNLELEHGKHKQGVKPNTDPSAAKARRDDEFASYIATKLSGD